MVLDPVMVPSPARSLLDEGAEEALSRELLPRATVITPNLPEARALADTLRGGGGTSGEARSAVAHALGPRRWW